MRAFGSGAFLAGWRHAPVLPAWPQTVALLWDYFARPGQGQDLQAQLDAGSAPAVLSVPRTPADLPGLIDESQQVVALPEDVEPGWQPSRTLADGALGP